MEGYEHVQRVRSRGLKTADLSYQGGRPNIRPKDKLKRPPSRLSNPIECASRQQVLRERTGGCSPDEYYLADVITKIVNGHSNSMIDELLPWAYANAPALKDVA
jgi:hypothetical protein